MPVARISRREFLARTGRAGGLVVAIGLGAGCSRESGHVPTADSDGLQANLYVNVRRDGGVEIVCHRSEMGQGIRTSLAQVIADELEADWERIELRQAQGDERYASQNTDGSTSIRTQFDVLRTAGATARDLLIAAAASTWDVPAAECIARAHAVHHAASGRSAAYGELVDVAAGLPLPDTATFKDAADYRYIGKPMRSIDAMALTTGTAVYGIDATVPGMLYASIERSPVLGGSVADLDDTAAREVAGVVDVIRMPATTSPPVYNILNGVAVLATNTWAAEQGRKALQIEWQSGDNASYDSDAYRERLIETVRRPGTVVLNRGDADIDTPSVHEAVYYAPHLGHAPMEPPAALAVVEGGRCEVWACTQHPVQAQRTVAATLGIDVDDVTVNVTLLGGAFGRKSKPDFIAEAAYLARESGQPVRVTWTREDDLRHGYLHSVSAQYYRAGQDEDGRTVSWLQRSAFPSITSTFAADVARPGNDSFDLGATDAPWDVPNRRIEAGEARAHVRIGWLRSVYNIFHAFGASSFVDELAHVKGQEPKAHLLDMIGPDRRIDPTEFDASYGNYSQPLEQHPIDTGRLRAVIEKVAELADWGRELPPGRGLGIAAHRSFLSYVGVVAEVTVDDAGKLQVDRIWSVIDAGRVVNPDRVRAQLEGAAIFGMSLAIHGELTASGGAVVQGNFDRYPVIRMNEAPATIDTFIMPSDAPPGGVGEPGVPPVAPAICNALFAATGERVRDLPLRNAGYA